MKKIFTLIAVMMLSFIQVFAGDIFIITFNGANAETKNGETVDAGTFFSWNSAKHNFNSKFSGASWGGIDFTKGLKMEGTTMVSFKSTAEATITIVRSNYNADKTIKFDENELSGDVAGSGNCSIYTMEKVAAGDHAVTRGSGETGLFAIKVEYTGETKTQLASPEITVDASNGQVTIGTVANAKEIRYTIDGAAPTAEVGEVYSAPFTAEDGVVVKAVAIGEGSYINSDIVSKQVLIDGTVPVSPIIKSQNGTVAITCATAASTIEYSTDGTSYNAYTRAFTLTANGKVYARAMRGEKTSEIAEQEVSIQEQPNDVTTKIIAIPDDTNDNSFDVDGYTMTITGNAGKNYTLGNAKITVNGEEMNSAKLSNGAQNTLKLPNDMKAVRLTLISYINAASVGGSISGWSEVNGVNYDVTEVPMGAYTDVEGYNTNPDVRVYLIDGQNEITFTNKGNQLCFVAIVDVASETTVIPTGIDTVKTNTENADAPIYNLAGQKVDKSFKGVVIQNGVKRVQK